MVLLATLKQGSPLENLGRALRAKCLPALPTENGGMRRPCNWTQDPPLWVARSSVEIVICHQNSWHFSFATSPPLVPIDLSAFSPSSLTSDFNTASNPPTTSPQLPFHSPRLVQPSHWQWIPGRLSQDIPPQLGPRNVAVHRAIGW